MASSGSRGPPGAGSLARRDWPWTSDGRWGPGVGSKDRSRIFVRKGGDMARPRMVSMAAKEKLVSSAGTRSQHKNNVRER